MPTQASLMPTWLDRRHMPLAQTSPNEFFCHPVLLGDNLYLKDRPKVTPPPRAGGGGGGGEAAVDADSDVGRPCRVGGRV